MQVNYKNVMKQYSLGPNGGILTSLNLFATRFDQARIAQHLSMCPAYQHPCIRQKMTVQTFATSPAVSEGTYS